MQFEWDEAKDEQNRRKHRLSLRAGTLVFADPHHDSGIDPGSYGEERWRTYGKVGSAFLVVSHTIREEGGDEIYRIISVRPMTRRERKRYEEG